MGAPLGSYLRHSFTGFTYLIMRQIFITLLTLSAGSALAQSPIITRADMPAYTSARPIDSLRLSAAAIVLPAGAPALTVRGANQTWNYSGLVATSQRVESYMAVPASLIYGFTFGAFGGVNRATVASPQSLPLPPGAGAALPITDPYQFFNVSAAGATPSTYRSVGYGGTLSGQTVPITYTNQAQQDIIYRFPLSYSSAADSSNSFFSTPAALSTVGYFSQKRKRVNRPDAWGTLTTPFGTFQTVRIVTRLEDHDSISLGGLSQGFDVPTRHEYKWLAVGQHVPLLTITTTEVAGAQTISSVEYRDIYRRIVRPTATLAAIDGALSTYPNPSEAGSPLLLTVPAGSGPLTVSATDLVGRQLFSQHFAEGSGNIGLPAELFGSFRGVALLTVSTTRGIATRRVVRE